MFKLVRKVLRDKKERLERGLFFVEGVNFVHQAIEGGWKIERLYYVPELIDSDFKREIIKKNRGVAETVSRADFASVANKKDIQGIGALVNAKKSSTTGATIVLENVSNPGNLGSILRAASAFGVKTVITIQPCVDFYNPDTVRASMGAIFGLNLISVADSEKLLEELNKSGYQNLATSLAGDAADLKSMAAEIGGNDKMAIWFGNEARGLSRVMLDKIKDKVRIKMTSRVDSLNLAESVAVVLFGLMKL